MKVAKKTQTKPVNMYPGLETKFYEIIYNDMGPKLAGVVENLHALIFPEGRAKASKQAMRVAVIGLEATALGLKTLAEKKPA